MAILPLTKLSRLFLDFFSGFDPIYRTCGAAFSDFTGSEIFVFDGSSDWWPGLSKLRISEESYWKSIFGFDYLRYYNFITV